ncbi:MAG: hypothetical protein ACR2RF_00160 [Geminicoccaceae bacterium]
MSFLPSAPPLGFELDDMVIVIGCQAGHRKIGQSQIEALSNLVARTRLPKIGCRRYRRL